MPRDAEAARRRLFWTLQISGWLVFMPLFVVVSMFIGLPRELAVFTGISRQVIGFLLTLALWRIYRRWPAAGPFTLHQGLQIAGLVVATVLVDFTLFELLRLGLGMELGAVSPRFFHTVYSLGRFFPYIGWTLLYFWLRHLFHTRDRDLRLAHAEIAARESELQVLRAQLNPHFLFNALNAIIADADDRPDRVKTNTYNLASFLRFSLSQRDHFAPLGHELEAMENYLHLERARWEDRLDWSVEVAPDVRERKVPTALFLPLVENALKYGQQTSPQKLHLRLGAEVRGDLLAIYAENSGRWIDPDPTGKRSTGIGLTNLRRRLALLCGSRASVAVSSPPGFVRVEIQVPLNAAASPPA